jgi:sucrose-6-phosphate hydrolase SacC (GH32 family)
MGEMGEMGERAGREPLYRDPIFDGSTDPVVVWNTERRQWWMFYTQRRASAPGPGVAWVHGTDIGIAVSTDDGATWVYAGTARGLDYEPGRNTYWAPEVFWAEGAYQMLVSYISGVPDRWEGHARTILHYSSANLFDWRLAGPLDLASDKVIDAAVFRLPSGGFRMWYKDEARESHTYSADSADLATWSDPVPVVTGRPHEGPNVFELGGWYWLIVDEWRGLGVYRSTNLANWRYQGLILDVPGKHRHDADYGRHADVVGSGDGETAYIFYFTHPGLGSGADPDSYEARRSCIEAAALRVEDRCLVCDRDAPISSRFLRNFSVKRVR